MFGDLTTLTLGSPTAATASARTTGGTFTPKVTWLGHAQSRSYEVGLSQILTKDLIAGVTLEVITDQGLLSTRIARSAMLTTAIH